MGFRGTMVAAGLAGMLLAPVGGAFAQPAPAPAGVASPAMRAAWDSYYRTLDEMRAAIEATPRFRDHPQDRAKAYHTLMEMQAMAYNFLIAPRMTNPRISSATSWQTDIYTLGENSPDFLYGCLFVDGTQTYRVSGRLGDAKLLMIQTLDGVLGGDGVKTTGNYDLADMTIGKDGRYEIMLGGPKRPGNWIPLDPKIGYQLVFFRRVLADWNDDPGEIRADRISPLAPSHYDADEFDEVAMAARIRRAESYVRYMTKYWVIDLYDSYIAKAGGRKNALALLPGVATSEIGSPFANYAMGVFALKDDEALLIEMPEAPDGVYWSFATGDVWSRTLDFQERQTSLNMDKAKVDADGALRVVISNRDPGIANWLDTAGRQEGAIVFRNYRAHSAPVPAARLVKFADLGKLLPRDTALVTPEQRAAALAARRTGFLKLFGE